ncbi:type II secretion system F family protein [Methylobacillus arboreus]|uniref:type II secretion system F family protein n=1 Tax=Methylobacillus arboreus TaxID=755170 RepID=UPI001E632E54|nr:type II secretion system F family protein [Methylobacillus arboreus]MCB5189658.1 type II secretion system F family protein [Methylobacillus arboreus]
MNRWIVLSFCIMLLVLALLLWSASKQKQVQAKARLNFEQALPYFGKMDNLLPGQHESWITRARLRFAVAFWFEPAPWHIVVIGGFLLLFLMLGNVYMPMWQASLCTLILAAVVLVVVPYLRLRRHQRVIVAQIPLFIDQVSRALSTGKSVEGAVRGVTEDMQMPLRAVLDRVVRATDLGVSFADAMQAAAELHHIKELGLIALAIRISSNYGSSPQELLKSIVQMIRQREQAQRELAAMTGETKITAWVLSLTPLLIVAYMFSSNPGYIDMMLNDPSGALIFKAALIMQGVGILIFWRMMKSI